MASRTRGIACLGPIRVAIRLVLAPGGAAAQEVVLFVSYGEEERLRQPLSGRREVYIA